MFTNDQIIDLTIEKFKGRIVKKGTIVAIKDFPRSCEFIGYKDGKAIVNDIKDGNIEWSASEIFDCNLVSYQARYYSMIGIFDPDRKN